MKEKGLRQNPFPGLREFSEDEAYLFFGREKQIDELLKKLRTSRFLAVLGESGSGKSSLVKAGILPALHSGFMVEAGSTWHTLLLRPGMNPIKHLSDQLVTSGIIDYKAKEKEIIDSITEATLRRSDKGLIDAIYQAGLEKGENMLVIIDQFEELFSFNSQERQQKSSKSDATTFVNLLLQATSQKELPIYVIITLRSDFLGSCSEFHGLPEAINRAQYLIPSMTREESRRAISGPLAVSQIDIAPRLMTRLLNDLPKTQDQLAVLQFTMHSLCDQLLSSDNPKTPLDFQHYEQTGHMSEIINRYAESLYKEIDDMKNLRIADIVFSMLTNPGIEQKDLRQPNTVKELAEIANARPDDVIQVINHFRRPGYELLHPIQPTTITTETTIDLCHESLMREWRRFKVLIEEEQQSAKLYMRLAESAKAYQYGKGGLWKDPDLMLARTWYLGNRPNAAWAKRYNPYFESAITFLKASEDQKEAEQNKKHNTRYTQYKKLYKRTIAFAIIALAALVGLAISGIALQQRKQEVEQLNKKYQLLSQTLDTQVLIKQAEYFMQQAEKANATNKKIQQLDKALFYINKVLTIKPEDFQAHSIISNAYEQKAQVQLQAFEFKACIKTCGQGLQIKPRSAPLKSIQIIAYSMNGQLDIAIEQYQSFNAQEQNSAKLTRQLLEDIEHLKDQQVQHPGLNELHVFLTDY